MPSRIALGLSVSRTLNHGVSGPAAPTVALAQSNSNANGVVGGTMTATLTLTGDTWVTAGALFNAARQGILNAFVAGSSPTWGWNAQAVPNFTVTDVVRTSNSIVTVSFNAIALYGAAAAETVTVTLLAAALAGGVAPSNHPTLTVALSAPTLASLSVTSGVDTGGTATVATGTNLMGATATVGGASATGVSNTNPTLLNLTTPAGTDGAQDVVVTTGGGSATLTGGFTYTAPVTLQPVIESLLVDIGTAAGGTKMTIFGRDFTGVNSVTIAGASATSVVVVNNWKLTCVTPSGTASETMVDVVVSNGTNSNTFAASFEYADVATTTYASETFAGGTTGAYTKVGGANTTVVNVPSARGTATKCVQCVSASGGLEASISLAILNNPLLQTHGLWLDSWQQFSSATVALIASAGQIKDLLCRVNNTTPETIMGIGGVQGSQRGGQMTNAIDSGIVSFVGSGNFGGQGDNIWHRKTVQLTRNSGASTGRIRLWIDSKLVGTVTAATIGANTTTDTYTPRKGEVFTQATPAGTLTVFIADSQDSNGYREPLDS